MQESMRVYYEDAHKPVRTAGLAHSSLGISCKGARNASRFPQARFNTFIVINALLFLSVKCNSLPNKTIILHSSAARQLFHRAANL